MVIVVIRFYKKQNKCFRTKDDSDEKAVMDLLVKRCMHMQEHPLPRYGESLASVNRLKEKLPLL
jgi:hypothetical protein